VSQIKQPAWAEPHILQEPPPKKPSQKNLTRSLEIKAESAHGVMNELKSRLGIYQNIEVLSA
jgi:hypothetical protein